MKKILLITLVSALFSFKAFTQTVIFSEDFDGISGTPSGTPGNAPFPSGWLRANVDQLTPASNVSYIDDAWVRRADLNDTLDSCAYSTSWYAPAGVANDWMWTPAVTLPGDTSIRLSWNAMILDANYPDGYEVRIMNVAPTGGAGNIGNQGSSTLLFSTLVENDFWTNRSVSLASFAGQTVYIGFRNNSTDKFVLIVDDIQVIKTCANPISNYQIISNGSTSICNGNTVTLDAGSGYNNYSWSTGQNTQSITVSNSGTYSVQVQNTDGCTASASIAVTNQTPYSGQQICIVTVNQNTGKNLVVWEKTPGLGIDSFRIYRETSVLNDFQPIGTQPYAAFSTFEDVQSNPQQNSNRYVITTIDGCGESSFSNAHKTIHLISNVGANNEMNLIWNNYEGVSAVSFNIYRGPSPNNLSLLTQIASSSQSYTDLNPPAPPIYYQVEIVFNATCNPTAKTESYSSTMSNILEVLSLGIDNNSEVKGQLFTMVDGTGNTSVNWTNLNFTPQQLALFDLAGKQIASTQTAGNNQVILNGNIAKGIYIAELSNGNHVLRKKIVVQ